MTIDEAFCSLSSLITNNQTSSSAQTPSSKSAGTDGALASTSIHPGPVSRREATRNLRPAVLLRPELPPPTAPARPRVALRAWICKLLAPAHWHAPNRGRCSVYSKRLLAKTLSVTLFKCKYSLGNPLYRAYSESRSFDVRRSRLPPRAVRRP